MSEVSSSALRRAVRGVEWAAVVIYILFIFTLTHMPLDGVKSTEWMGHGLMFWLNKVLQCGLYAGLAALLGCAMFPLSRDPVKTIENISGLRVMIFLALVAGIAIFDELTQPFFGRKYELMDVIANIGGVIPGFCLFLVLNELRHQLLGDRQ